MLGPHRFDAAMDPAAGSRPGRNSYRDNRRSQPPDPLLAGTRAGV